MINQMDSTTKKYRREVVTNLLRIRIDLGKVITDKKELNFTDYTLYDKLLKGKYFNKLTKEK